MPGLLLYATLPQITRAITQRRKVRFSYEKRTVIAEPHLLGTHPRTGAYLMLGWTGDPVPEWTFFRYSLMRGFEVTDESFNASREGCDPPTRRLGGIIASTGLTNRVVVGGRQVC